MSTQPLWHWPELCTAVGSTPLDGPAVTGVSIDSRTLLPGDLFVALKGDPGPRFNTASRSTRDGHDFVADAVARGAAGIVVDRPIRAPVPALVVRDTLDALWQIGAAARSRFGGRVFAVTGSSGKTTAKTFLAAALRCPASAGSYNNFWGVPLSLARTPANAAAAVFEVGTNHPGEIRPLAELVRPHVAVVLNVGQAHLEFFPGWDALRREKLSIAAGVTAGGALVVPDDLDLAGVLEGPRLVRFGTGAAADARLLAEDATGGEATYDIGGRVLRGRVPGGGHHRALTLAAVLAALAAAGLPLEGALAIDDDVVPAGRGRRHAVAGLTLIDDSYNANPASMAAALEALASAPGPRFAILGEMLELGEGSVAAHQALASACAPLDGVVCVGGGMRALFAALPAAQRLGCFERAGDIDPALLASVLRPGATVLVKGSNRVFWAQGFVERLLQRLGEEGQSR